MTDTMENDRAVIGNNQPPEEIAPAHETWMDHADSLAEDAEGFTAVTTDEQAEAVGEFATSVKDAVRDAEKARKAAKQPHLDAGKAVDEGFKPVTAKLDRIKGVAQSLLTPWIDGQRHADAIVEAIAREKAEAADEAARRAMAEVDETDIEQVEAVAAKQAEAKAAKQGAKNAKAKPATVQGVTFRTKRTAEMTDRVALLKHIAKHDADAMTAFAQDWMHKAVRGGSRDLPGVAISETKEAV